MNHYINVISVRVRGSPEEPVFAVGIARSRSLYWIENGVTNHSVHTVRRPSPTGAKQGSRFKNPATEPGRGGAGSASVRELSGGCSVGSDGSPGSGRRPASAVPHDQSPDG